MLDVLDSGSWSVSGINKFSTEFCGCKAKIMGNKSSSIGTVGRLKGFRYGKDHSSRYLNDGDLFDFYYFQFDAKKEFTLRSESRGRKDTKWVSACTPLRTPHLVNGFLFTLRLIAGIFSSLWVDGLRLAIFPSPKQRFHLASEMTMMASCSPTPRIQCGLRCFVYAYTHFFLSSVVLVINWISSLRRGRSASCVMTWSYCLILMKNGKLRNVYVAVTPGQKRWMDGWTALSHGCVSKDTWHIRSYCKQIVIKCTVNGNLKLDTFSLLMTMKQALMTSNWSVCVSTKEEEGNSCLVTASRSNFLMDGKQKIPNQWL